MTRSRVMVSRVMSNVPRIITTASSSSASTGARIAHRSSDGPAVMTSNHASQINNTPVLKAVSTSS